MRGNPTVKKLVVEELECKRCDYAWWPKIKNDKIAKPKTCPRCRSPYWEKPIQRKTTSAAKKKRN